MTFKDCIKSDIADVFLDTDEFSEIHTINGKQMPAMVDEMEQIEREKRYNQDMNGAFTNQKLIYVSASDYGAAPAQGSRLVFDGTVFLVSDVVEEDGMYSITIDRTRAR